MKRYAVFCCMGLGDGLISMILSHNLQKDGAEVVTFHPFLSQMQSWFPFATIEPFPDKENLQIRCSGFDSIYVFYEKSPAMQDVIESCRKIGKEMIILNPIATKKRDYPFWENGKFDGTKTFASNLFTFSKDVLGIKDSTISCGIIAPPHLIKHKHPKRVVIHPTSSRSGKNWGANRFISLAKALSKLGYTPSFILSRDEKILYPQFVNYAADCSTLSEMASYLYESGYMIGNDSGIGHLASSLGLPTLTISRSKMASDFWRPSWSKALCVLPPSWVPNIKALRLRDKYWKYFISKRAVLKAFHALVKSG